MSERKKLTPYEEHLISKFIDYINNFNQIQSIIVYGSRSKGLSNELSDLDIALIVEEAKDIKKIEKIIEQWIIDSSPEILLHFIVIDTSSLTTSEIGKEIVKGDIVWLKQHRD